MNRRALVVGAVLLVALGGLGVALLAGGDESAPAGPSADGTTTTVVDLPPGTKAPLTGLEVADEDLALLARTPLAAKIDNHPDAAPQWGLDDADVVVEVRVEGISRFLTVYHSRDVGDIGPIRSARTSDPDLLAVFGRPLTAWSGANPTTTELMRSTAWIQDASADRLDGAYRRERSRRAPHNLVLDARAAFGSAEEPATPPTPVFEYRGADEPVLGEPVPGFELLVGLSRSEYVWDAERGGWLRWSEGEALQQSLPGDDAGSTQVAATNVLVLETEYVRSEADPTSPEAVSVGEGRAWVFTGGNRIAGRWTRPDRTAPWTLTADDGTPIRLTPGSTWVALPAQDDEPRPLSADDAAQLRG